MRTIYASTMSRDALAYRQSRGLIQRDEQMALLVQRVSGEFFGTLYFPHAAGVGYSFNPFVWDPDIDPQEGLLRLVFGLGTRAVDRHDDDYTRIVAVNAPLKRPEATFDDLHRYSQRVVDVLDLAANRHAHISFDTAARTAVNIPLSRFATFDYEMDRRAREMRLDHVFPWVLTFDELLTETGFLDEMRAILHTLAGAYAHPVDIEFTVNFLTKDDFRINLLQCRPFQVKEGIEPVTLPENPDPARVVMATAGPIIGEAVTKRIDRIVYIVPARYSVLNESERYTVARHIGEIMNAPGAPPVTMLVGPGRWGTKMAAMGVPVSFAEIRNVSVICEVVTMHAGLTPDISLGTHFFNDLVELGIVYIGLYPERPGYRLNEEWLLSRPNLRPGLIKAHGAPAEAVHICDAAPGEIIIHADVVAQRSLCVIS